MTEREIELLMRKVATAADRLSSACRALPTHASPGQAGYYLARAADDARRGLDLLRTMPATPKRGRK